MQPDTKFPGDAERARRAVLKSYSLAADLFEVPTAQMSFAGEHEAVFEGGVGLDAGGTTPDASFCSPAMARGDMMVVAGEPFDRLDAGAPIVTLEGHRLGPVCVIDTVRRSAPAGWRCGTLQSPARNSVDHLGRRRLDAVRSAVLRRVATTSDAISRSDEAGTVTFWNAAAERIFGDTGDERVGPDPSVPTTADRVIEHPLLAPHRIGGAEVRMSDPTPRRPAARAGKGAA